MKQLLLWLLCIANSFSIAQSNNQSQLTIDQIMQGDDFVGYLPTNIDWSENNKDIYFSWNPDKDTINSTYKVNINSKKIDKASFEELKLKMSISDVSKDGKWSVYDKEGDLFLRDNVSNTLKRLTNTNAYESNPQFSGNQKAIIFQQSNNFYLWHLTDNTIEQLTDFNSGNERPEKPLSEQDQWLLDDQLKYFNILEKRKGEDKASADRREQTKLERPETIYLGDKNIFGLNITPDLNYVSYRLYTPSKSKNTVVPDYVTESGYTTDLNTRSKVGGLQNGLESWILNLKTGEHYQIKTDDIEGIKDKPSFLKEYADNVSDYVDTYENPRDVTISSPIFSDDGKAFVNVTSSDNKDRWIMLLTLADGSLKNIDRQHDDAWIGGPGVGWFAESKMGWLSNETIWFMSEKTGYTHLYTANIKTGRKKTLTQGDFEILDVKLSIDKKNILYNQ